MNSNRQHRGAIVLGFYATRFEDDTDPTDAQAVAVVCLTDIFHQLEHSSIDLTNAVQMAFEHLEAETSEEQ